MVGLLSVLWAHVHHLAFGVVELQFGLGGPLDQAVKVILESVAVVLIARLHEKLGVVGKELDSGVLDDVWHVVDVHQEQ